MAKNGTNVIDMLGRRRAQLKGHVAEVLNGDVVNLEEKRQELITRERRRNKRTIVSEGFGGFIVVPEKGLLEVMLFDIQGLGLSFDTLLDSYSFQMGQRVALRIYINQHHYFPVDIEIKHVTEHPEEGLVRHGAEFITAGKSGESVHAFVKFVETVSPHLKLDSGDLKIPVYGG